MTYTHLVQMDIQDGRPEWTDYVSADSVEDAIRIMRGYATEATASFIVRMYVWPMTEPGSYMADAAGDPLAAWSRELDWCQPCQDGNHVECRRGMRVRRARRTHRLTCDCDSMEHDS